MAVGVVALVVIRTWYHQQERCPRTSNVCYNIDVSLYLVEEVRKR